MIIIPLKNLSLSWKPTSTVYHLRNGVEIDVPEDALEYLSKVHPGKFTIKTIDEVNIEQLIDVKKQLELQVEQKKTDENPLFNLLEENKDVMNIDVKDVITKAIEKKVILREGIWYTYNNEKIGRGISKLKEALEKNKELLLKINSQI